MAGLILLFREHLIRRVSVTVGHALGARVPVKRERILGLATGGHFILEDFLNNCQGEDMQMEFSKPNDPALFLDPKDKEYLHIIMPVRIQS